MKNVSTWVVVLIAILSVVFGVYVFEVWLPPETEIEIQTEIVEVEVEVEKIVIEEVEVHSLTEFLDRDETDLIRFNYDYEFVCVQFSHVLNCAARRDGFQTDIVVVDLDDRDEDGDHILHAINQFRLDDGVVFVEPQSDEVVGWFNLDEDQTLMSMEILYD